MIDPEVVVKIEKNRIEYLGHAPGGGELFDLLIGGKVNKEFYFAILDRALSFSKTMKPGIWYTVEEMCGEEYWSSIIPWNRNAAGMCVADAVKRKWLPFFKKPQHTTSYQTNLYRIQPAEMHSKDKEA